MYKLKGYRSQQVRSCTYQDISIKFIHKELKDIKCIVKYLNELGYEEVEQHFNGSDTKNLFIFCRSIVRFPIGHKFHEIHVMAIPIKE